MASLAILSPPEFAGTFDVGDDITIGRSAPCRLQLDHRSISRDHCRVHREPDGYYAEDLGSSNGTRVNGKRIDRCKIASGDRIELGRFVLVFEEHGAAPAAADLVSRVLESDTDMRGVCRLVLDVACSQFGAQRGFVVMFDRDGRSRAYAGTANANPELLPVSRTVLEWIRKRRLPLLSVNAQDDERLGAAESLKAMKSVMGVPVISADELVAAIYVDHDAKERAFTQEDLKLLENFARHLAASLRQVRRLHEQTERLEAVTHELERARGLLEESSSFENIVGRSRKMRSVFAVIRKVGPTELPVIVEGETGTGKELVARALHYCSRRRAGPFIAENVAALSPGLVESELFGHVKGAFTGADRDKRGLFHEAAGGTLLLDEIGDMDLALQAKLLRVLEEKAVRPVGGQATERIDVRVVVATNRDLEEEVKERRFRRDLFYRLNGARVKLPPLRERREDIADLAEFFLRGKGKRLDRAALAALMGHPWPGNVRELRNCLERLAVLCAEAAITAQDVRSVLPASVVVTGGLDFKSAKQQMVEEFERRYLVESLTRHRGNISQVAEEAGLERRHLYTLLERYGINPDQYRRA